MNSKIACFLLASALASGCSSVEYADPDAPETLTIAYGSTDLQTFAQSMADSLIADQDLAYLFDAAKGEDQRIVLYPGGIAKRTHEHIDTKAVMDSIKTALVKSDKFVVLASEQGQGEIGEQVRFQQGSGRVDSRLAKAFGRQKGADVILYGTLMAIDKKTGRTLESFGTKSEDVYYKLTMECVNIETGVLIWIEEKEIRKVSQTGLFG